MAYNTQKIKEGVNLHLIETNKFKTNLLAIFLTVPLEREKVTINSIIPALLKSGTANLKSQEEISIKLENMYGADFDCGIEKSGDNQILKFYLEVLNNDYIPNKENIEQEAINLLLDIVFNPLTENGEFKKEYVETEKEKMKQIIERKIDNKDAYALERCIEEMYKDLPYSIYKYGYVEDLKSINPESSYKEYLNLLKNAKIDIFVSGNINKEEIINLITKNENILKLEDRKDRHVINSEETEIKSKKDMQEIIEKKAVNQGKLVIGLDVFCNEPNSKYVARLYNVILGESATSKLFQNVREKASLAYTARSNYIKQKNNIFIRCGIEIENYRKAVDIIKKQIEDMKNGEFSLEDVENAKKYILSGLKTIQDEQDSEITYYLGQELSNEFINFEEYNENIKRVTKEDIKKIANQIEINTIYFLKND